MKSPFLLIWFQEFWYNCDFSLISNQTTFFLFYLTRDELYHLPQHKYSFPLLTKITIK